MLASGGAVGKLAVRVADLERSLTLAKQELRASGGAASFVDEPWIQLDYQRVPIKLVASSARRRNSVAKEPFTVAWIERSLRAGDVFYDIGANIGAYTLIAAAVAPGAQVIAFEPGFDSYVALCRNIVLNEFGDRVVACPIALSGVTGLVTFHYRRLGVANARHQVGGEPPFEPAFSQRLLAMRLDDLLAVSGIHPPTHLKLDVDGAELEVLGGATSALTGETLREIQVEVEPGDRRIETRLSELGFEVVERHTTPAVDNVLFARERSSPVPPR